mmetsp:Transcript_4920/g.4174  ORF Transcript_4920/g.4174 Transcript_4920/m.4174 type:complete len:94 (-) Transcript_4920:416-697(-)
MLEIKIMKITQALLLSPNTGILTILSKVINKMKNSKGMDRSEVIKSILEGMKIVDTKRKQNSVRKTESLPKLSLKEEQIATPVKTKFHFRMEK